MRGLETQLCQTWEELEESLRGDYGPEAQRDAEMQYQQIQEQEQQAAAGGGRAIRGAGRVAREAARAPPSNAEIQGLGNISDYEAIPDLMETYGEQLGSRTYDERDREALTAEYAEQAFDRAEAGEDVFEPAGTE